MKKIYLAYKNMVSRCYNPKNVSYKHYGERGITVCNQWLNSKDSFVKWAIESGHGENLSLDRINNDKGYSPSNCKWSNMTEQLRNQRRNRIIKYKGVSKTISEWAEDIGIKADTLHRRIDVYKFSIAKALTPGSLRDGWSHGTRAGYESHGCRCNECKTSHAKRHREMRLKRKERKLNEQ